MNPFHEEQKRRTSAAFVSAAAAIAFSLLGLYNWMELRVFVISMLAALKVDPLAWQGIDNLTFLLFGVAWLAYVFYSHYYLKKQALKGRVLQGGARLLAVQLWLLALCRGVPALFGNTGRAGGFALMLEAAAALLLTAYIVTNTRKRRETSINHGERR